MIFKTRKYGDTVNSYDIVKFLAISLMMIDHIGVFFFHEELWWRTLGRICVPMWFFLVGYSRSSWKDPLVIGGMCVLIAADIFLHSPLLSFNILASITVIRLVHSRFLDRYLEEFDGSKCITILIVTILWYPLTTLLWEYGTLAFLPSICGALIRKGKKDTHTKIWFTASAILFCAAQAFVFDLSLLQTSVMSIGVAVTFLALFSFELRNYAWKAGTALRYCFLFIARNTLYIYVIHWLVFLSLYHHQHPELYTTFKWIRQVGVHIP